MTKEYIERGALLKDARKNRAIGLCEADIVDVQTLINEQPAADVVEVKHGRWLARARKNGVGKCCSACMTAFNFAPTPYCPNCGAKMDGE